MGILGNSKTFRWIILLLYDDFDWKRLHLINTLAIKYD